MWFQRLHEFWKTLGFTGNKANPSLFIALGEHIIYTLVYIDDIVISSSNEEYVQHIVRKMEEDLAIRHLGDLRFFLGIQVQRSKDEIHLHQQQYLVNLLKSGSIKSRNYLNHNANFHFITNTLLKIHNSNWLCIFYYNIIVKQVHAETNKNSRNRVGDTCLSYSSLLTLQ